MALRVLQSRGLTVCAPRLEDTRLGNSVSHLGLGINRDGARTCILNPHFSTFSPAHDPTLWTMRGSGVFLIVRKKWVDLQRYMKRFFSLDYCWNPNNLVTSCRYTLQNGHFN
jgi:hypothetical protein